MDFYESLGVSRSASAEEIRKAYRKKAKKTHPDYNNRKTAFYEMVELNLIRDTLLNQQNRLEYDKKINSEVQYHHDSRVAHPYSDHVLTKTIKNLFTYHCRTCGQEMSSTWQGYCLFHFLEFSGQLNNSDHSFIYHGYTYYWSEPQTEHATPSKNTTKIMPITIYLIICLAVLAGIIYNLYILFPRL